MHCRFRVGLHGKTFVDYQAAWLEARQRGRRLYLVVGSRALLALPDRFTLAERVGALVYHAHATPRGKFIPGPGFPRGALQEGDPWIRVDYVKGLVTMTTRTQTCAS